MTGGNKSIKLTLREFLRGKTYVIGLDRLVTGDGDIYIHFERGQPARPGALEGEIIKHLDKQFKLIGNRLWLMEDGYNGIFKERK